MPLHFVVQMPNRWFPGLRVLLENAPDDLHVRLRHRLATVPGEAFGGNASLVDVTKVEHPHDL